MNTGAKMKDALPEVLLRSAVIDEDIALEGEMRIGREKDCEIQLDDSHISRFHARITVADDLILLEDLGSTNGTYVNGNRIRGQQAVSVGDELRFHNCLFRLVSKQSCDLDRTVFGWPVNIQAAPPTELPSRAHPVPVPAEASPPLPLDLEQAMDPELSLDFEPGCLAGSEAEEPFGPALRNRKSAIDRQLGKELRETRDFLERVQSLPIGSWLVLNDQGGDVYVLCKLAARFAYGDCLRFVSDTGLYIFEKSSRELAVDLQYDRARVLDKGPLFARIAVLLTGAMRRARKARESDSKLA
jgi:hypothetical protein